MSKSKLFMEKNGTTISRYFIVIMLFMIISILRPGFSSGSHVKVLLLEAAIIGIAAIGQTFVILTGGIDMSVPWLFTAGAMAAYVSGRMENVNSILIILGILLGGFALGMINGVAVAYLGVPSIVMTIGLNTILQGSVTGLTSGAVNGAAPNIIYTLATGSIFNISYGFILWMGLTAIVMLILRKTKYGRSLYALGNSRGVVYFSGIKRQRVEALAYGVSGLFAALAGMLMVGKTGSAYLGMGNPFQFESIAAVALGGVSMAGGSGSYMGTVAGSMTIAVLLAVLTALNLSPALQQIFYGLILFVAILAATIQNNRKMSSKL
ncbi:ABC transporter permease [Oscillibacter sp.]|uniref:ABC transporter permease n=1 Tax=Oscillibacter sp. TaxID=1945593 RepID=UPI002618913C|nr:ABC transporter permease [Oscillibacter sp.]MDD3347638.1 ABC transporter permease [Oscillibacter sp.]